MVTVRMFALALATVFSVGGADAQSRTNIRGIVKQVVGDAVIVAKKQGGEAIVHLNAKTRISATAKFSLADVKPGMKLGVTTVVRGNDIVAIDVRPIPARAPDGLSPYDLAPNATMTNGILEGSVQGAARGNVISVNYGRGTVKVLAPPGTPMSRAIPGSKADIKPGATIFVFATGGKDGRLNAVRLQVSKNGVKPMQ